MDIFHGCISIVHHLHSLHYYVSSNPRLGGSIIVADDGWDGDEMIEAGCRTVALLV